MEGQAREQNREALAHRMRAAVAAGQARRKQHRRARSAMASERFEMDQRRGPRAAMRSTGAARSGAILTGAGTVLSDDLHLTVRLGDDTAFVPLPRVVLDPGLATVAGERVRDMAPPTLYLHAPGR